MTLEAVRGLLILLLAALVLGVVQLVITARKVKR